GTGSSPDPTSGLPRPGCGPCRPCSGVAPLARRAAQPGRNCPNPRLHGTGARAWRAPFPGDGGESAGPAREPATAWTAAASTAQRERGGKLVPAVARVPLGVLIPSVPFSSLIPSVPLFPCFDARAAAAVHTRTMHSHVGRMALVPVGARRRTYTAAVRHPAFPKK